MAVLLASLRYTVICMQSDMVVRLDLQNLAAAHTRCCCVFTCMAFDRECAGQ